MEACMGKIVLLVSREEMIYQAHNILQEKQYEIQEMRVVKTEDTVMEARQMIAAGATIPGTREQARAAVLAAIERVRQG